ncbi:MULTISPECIES: acyl-CoA thioesterase [unclassified Sphingomonas]|jgi:acyl-CoA thioesterase YciA|uniref:acyl-CoA thioesterase n=1 Tax=unclassified Sphingomonas TaxID=196159 RepID=UPI0006FDDC6E|nr:MULTISPECIES: acyl-CoA thioesterase [unclassified Sphingomonas]KQM28652.1 acyl-CoA thioesterase [Sphingomonas sp. Leaf9]KQM45355.1 acyl-CoA thioesterase [Sphingomonas sp. Leaf11]KQM86255.1 acyl-CoA thioesterase [Sphingomonas sp. Leaf23]
MIVENATTPPSDQPALRVTAMPADTNPYGDIFGGWIMSQMDMAAGLVAARHARGRAVTIAVDAMQFHAPVAVGDELSVYADLIKVGRTSMTIKVETWRRDRFGEATCRVTEAQFVFVAIDEHRKPRAIEG